MSKTQFKIEKVAACNIRKDDVVKIGGVSYRARENAAFGGYRSWNLHLMPLGHDDASKLLSMYPMPDAMFKVIRPVKSKKK